MTAVFPIFFGYTFFGMVVFGSIVLRFSTTQETAITLFSVLNGDRCVVALEAQIPPRPHTRATACRHQHPGDILGRVAARGGLAHDHTRVCVPVLVLLLVHLPGTHVLRRHRGGGLLRGQVRRLCTRTSLAFDARARATGSIH